MPHKDPEARRAYLRAKYLRECEAKKVYAREYYKANKEKVKAYNAQYRAARRDTLNAREQRRYYTKQDWILKCKYGLPHGEYARMYTTQNGQCAICGTWQARLAVDHDHDTNAIRELLCRKYNGGIGLLGDNEARVQKAADYLAKHRQRQEKAA